MKPAEFKKLIDRYLNHEANETERQLIDVWYQSFDGQSQKTNLPTEEEQRIKNDIYNQVKGTWHPSSKLIKPSVNNSPAGVLIFSTYRRIGINFRLWYGIEVHF